MATRAEEVLKGFAGSMAYSIPELFGFDPPDYVRQYRYDSPIGGFASSALGSSVPYIGWYKASKYVPAFERTLAKIGAGYEATAPFATGAARAAARFVPLEVGRIGVNQAWGDSSFGEMASSAALNLALEGTAGGLINAALMGKKKLPKASDLGVAIDTPPQIQLRAWRRELSSRPPEQMPAITARMNALTQAIRNEEPIAKTAHVWKLAEGKDSNDLESLFQVGQSDDFQIKKLINGQHHFEDEGVWKNLLGENGIQVETPEGGFEDFIRYPRVVTPKNESAAWVASQRIKKNMTEIGDGWHIAKEAEDDMYILAKKMKDGDIFVTKTDSPDYFFKRANAMAAKTMDENIWVKQQYDAVPSRGRVADRAIDFLQKMPWRVVQTATNISKPYQGATVAFAKLANITGTTEGLATMKDSKMIGDFKGFINRALLPRRLQFRGAPELDFALKQAEAIKDEASMTADDVYMGRPTGEIVGQSLIARSNARDKGLVRPNLIENAINKIKPADVEKLSKLAMESPSQARLAQMQLAGDLDEDQFNLLEAFRKAGHETNQDITLQKAVWGELKPISDYVIPKKLGISEIPKTKPELTRMVSTQIYGAYKSMAEQSIRNTMQDQMRMAMLNYPEHAKIFKDRYNDLLGVPRPSAVAINKMADNLLAPIVGKDSASTIAGFANRTLVTFTLGGLETAFNVVNVLSGITQAIPEIMYAMNAQQMGRYDYSTYFPAMGSGGPVGTMSIPNPLKIMQGGFKMLRNPDETMTQLYNMAVVDGTVAPRNLEEFAGEGARSLVGVRQAFKDGNYLSGMEALALLPMQRSEQWARTITYTLAANTARMSGMDDLIQIHRLAKEITQNSAYMYGQAYRPAIFNNPVGSVFGLFQNWYMNYVGSMMDYAGAGIKYGHWGPLLWQQSSLAAIGGITASPLYGLAEAFNDEFSNDGLTKNIYSMMEEEHADGILYGLPAYLTGLSVSSSVGVDPVRSLQSLYSPALFDRIGSLGQAVKISFDNYSATGQSPFESDDVRRKLVQAFAPRSIQRAFQVMSDGAINSSSTGYPVLKNPSISDKVFHAMGISPLELAKSNREANMLYNDKQARRALVSVMGNAYSEAMDARDSRQMWEIIKAAQMQGVDIHSVMKSAAARNKAGNSSLMERASDPASTFRLFGAYGLRPH